MIPTASPWWTSKLTSFSAQKSGESVGAGSRPAVSSTSGPLESKRRTGQSTALLSFSESNPDDASCPRR
jgi:hypothetical protein